MTAVLDFLKNALSKLGDLIYFILVYLISVLLDLWDLIEGAIWGMYDSIMNVAKTLIPSDWLPDTSGIESMLGFLNVVLCLRFALSLITLRYLAMGIVGIIRLVKSCIPGVSG